MSGGSERVEEAKHCFVLSALSDNARRTTPRLLFPFVPLVALDETRGEHQRSS